ncbi:MAG: lipopolysaccharide heptosyltransferase II [Deltaproteobacteria bacterium]|nr:lipopolysaccharide heptosyltransferase II [Deltaproteobacteria bacterium]
MRIEKSKINRILVRSPNWIGDVVMSIPAIENLKYNCPSAWLTVVAKPWVKALLENNPCVDEILLYDPRNGYLAKPKSILKAAKSIRRGNYDTAVLFQNAFEAALLVWLGQVKYRIGYCTDGRGLLLNYGIPSVKNPHRGHQVEYYLNLLRCVGLKTPKGNPKLFLSAEQKEKARQFLSEYQINLNKATVGLGPGAMYGEAKRWPAERFARVADLAVEKWSANILIFGSNKEKAIGSAVEQSMRHKALNLCGKTSLKEAIGLLSTCNFFVTNDSGLMHVAAALGVPTLAIFGSTDPTATGPLSEKARIIYHDVDCAPCLKPSCTKDFKCMLSVQAEEVWEELAKLRKKVEQ